MQAILETILTELQELRREQAVTQADVQELRRGLAATQTDVQELRGQMATKDDLQKGFAELKQLITEHHLENIAADEKLMETIMQLQPSTDQRFLNNEERLDTHEQAIDILRRNQFKLEIGLEKLKSR